jgi:hypothetical protein
MAPGPLQALRRANRLVAVGEHAQAAVLFERLAAGAHDLGMTRRAPLLYLQAARAHYLAGNQQAGFELLRQGFDLIAGSDSPLRLEQLGERVLGELDRLGLPEAAAEARRYLQPLVPGEDLLNEGATGGRLSLECPNCGAAIRPDEVEWLDGQTAECAYCGSMLRAE